MDKRIEDTSRFLEEFERDLDDGPDRLSVATWNRGLRLVLRNQLTLMKELQESAARSALQTAATEGGASNAEAKSTEGEDEPEDLSSIVAPPDLAGEAVLLFEIEKLNHWLSQEAGTLFQLRGRFAYVKAAGLNEGHSRATTENLKRMGYDKFIGRIEVKELEGEVALFENPNGGKRSWDD